jgi:hypothetical protein
MGASLGGHADAAAICSRLSLPPWLSILGPQIDEERCRKAVARVRAAGVTADEVEDVLRATAKGLLGCFEVARMLLEFEGTEH